jgi:hypothetical protein
MHGHNGQGLDGTGSPSRLSAPRGLGGSSNEKAILMMELPKRHATSLAGSRFGPLDLPLVLQLARAQCAYMNRFRGKKHYRQLVASKIPFCVKCPVCAVPAHCSRTGRPGAGSRDANNRTTTKGPSCQSMSSETPSRMGLPWRQGPQGAWHRSVQPSRGTRMNLSASLSGASPRRLCFLFGSIPPALRRAWSSELGAGEGARGRRASLRAAQRP